MKTREAPVVSSPEELLANAAWMRRLASSLVEDAAAADDIVQQTWLKVAERPPHSAPPGGGWLRTVIRNFAYRRRRDERRRASRERLAARPERVRDRPDQIVERAELQHRISGLVLALEEPYRSTVLLRFLEDMAPGEIARRQRIPEATVRSRITRALEKLRLRLDRLHHGNRAAWSAALAPLCGPDVAGLAESPASAAAAAGNAAGSASANTLLGGLTMSAKTVVAAGAVACIAFLAGVGAGRTLRPPASDETLLLESRAEIGRLERLRREALMDIDRLRAASRGEKDSLAARIAELEQELAGLRAAPAAESDSEGGGRSEAEDALLRFFGGKADLAELWETAHKRGELGAMEEIARIVDLVYALRLAQPDLPPEERAKLQRSLDANGFRKGYTRFARGDLEGAREAYEEHLAYLQSREAELRARGESLDPVTRIHRMRSESGLRVLEELGGRPAPAERDIGDCWVTAKRMSLLGEGGKAVGLVFRNAGDGRSAEFLRGLSQAFPGDAGVELVNVSFQRDAKSLDEQMAALREELSQLGFSGAAGFDPDAAGKSLFKRYHATVGSATFIVLNARGELVWHQQDPTGDHVLLARELLRAAGR